jgi:1-acyl-sn-glycerol-3-phosphate acyltransferase
MDIPFPPPEYHTPATRRRKPRYALFPRGTLPFTLEMFALLRWGRRLAARGEFGPEEMVAGCARVVDIVEGTGAKVHMTGLDILARCDCPVVLIANHMSTMETFILPAIVTPFRKVTFVVKESLVGGFFGPIMRTLEPITVTRRDPRADFKSVMTQGCDRVAAGWSVCIFPQTTRSPGFDAGRLNTLGVKLARRAGAPIVPVALKTDFYAPGWLVRDLGSVHPERDLRFAFGEPLDPGLSQQELHGAVVAFLLEHLTAWGVACVPPAKT